MSWIVTTILRIYNHVAQWNQFSLYSYFNTKQNLLFATVLWKFYPKDNKYQFQNQKSFYVFLWKVFKPILGKVLTSATDFCSMSGKVRVFPHLLTTIIQQKGII